VLNLVTKIVTMDTIIDHIGKFYKQDRN